MPALGVKLVLALGFDTVLQWVLRLLVALVVVKGAAERRVD